jgi:tRNA 2-thiouridine synthesizing protein C
MDSVKIFTIVSRHGPYGTDAPRQCFDLAIAAAVFDQRINYLFVGDGVLQLVKDQLPQSGRKNLGAMLGSLEMYGIDSVYVDQSAMERFGLELSDLVIHCQPANADMLTECIQQADMVFNQ